MLADPKYQRLTPCERSCWVTLMCLASLDDGIVKHCEEDYLMTQSGISPLSEDWNKTRGVLTKLEMLGMITQSRYHISVKNWQKRQQSNLTGYERVKKYRLKQRENNALITNDNVGDNANDNIDESRVDKNRIDKNIHAANAAGKTKKKKFTTLGGEVLKAFEEIDPKNKTYYSNTTQRAACDFLVSEYGFEEVKKRISFLPVSNKLPYFPSITTPNQLKEKWVQLQDKVEQYKTEKRIKNKVQEII